MHFITSLNVYTVDSQTELYLLGGTTPSSSGTTINATFVDTQETNKKSLTQEEEIMPAIIIGALLVIPIIIIIVIVIVIRIYKKGEPFIWLVTSVLSVSLCSCTKGHHIYSCIYIDSLYFHLFNENIHQNLSIALCLHRVYLLLFTYSI